MALPSIWGQGQIFAFSAIDGGSYYTDDLVGTLTSDRIGIRFNTKVRRELFIGWNGRPSPSFNAVLGDIIEFSTGQGDVSDIVYAERHLIIGRLGKGLFPKVFSESKCKEISVGDAIIIDTEDGEVTALIERGERFAFAYAKSTDDAINLALHGLALEIDEEINKKKLFYEKNTPECGEYTTLFGKCLSIMKTQLYSPEGRFKSIWSTPDRLPHKNLWLWDSVFHSIGIKNIDTGIAEELIYALLDTADDYGFIAHMSTPSFSSTITQPPVIAYGADLLYKKTGNLEFLKRVFEVNDRFILWINKNRRKGELHLYTWHMTDDVNCRCDESGMDNSPRFDTHHPLYAIDLTSFMANEARIMARIANILGREDKAEEYGTLYSSIAADANKYLWDENDKFYYDFDTVTGQRHKIAAVSSFLPLVCGIASEEQAKHLVSHLSDPMEFATDFPIPCISRSDATYGSDMWRGPVWINYNYMISHALRDYGYTELSDEIIEKTLKILNKWYSITGTVYEFYDSMDRTPPYAQLRKGEPFEPYDLRVKYQVIRDYGWTAALTLDMIAEKFAELNK